MEDGLIRGRGVRHWHMEQKVGLQGFVGASWVLLCLTVCGAGVWRVVEQEHMVMDWRRSRSVSSSVGLGKLGG